MAEKTQQVSIRVSTPLLKEIDEYAASHFQKRSQVVIMFTIKGLKAAAKK